MSAPKPPRPPSWPRSLGSAGYGTDGSVPCGSPNNGSSPLASSPPRNANDLYSADAVMSHEQTPLLAPQMPASHQERRSRHSRRQGFVNAAIAASTSFFGLPRSLSSASLRSTLGLEPDRTPGAVDWVSIAVIYWITLVSEASRGLMLPSTWPYLLSLGGTKGQLGLFVASFSVGRMATTVPLGYLSDNYSMTFVLAIASFIQVLGHFLYAISPSVTALIFSRVIVGFGSATMSVCRAHLTRAVVPALRTHHFAYLSALQFIGFAVLPGAGGALVLLPEFTLFPFMSFNGFTYPAYVLIFCNLIAVALLYMFYLEPPPNASSNRTRQQQARIRQQQREQERSGPEAERQNVVSIEQPAGQISQSAINLDPNPGKLTLYESVNLQNAAAGAAASSAPASSETFSAMQPGGSQLRRDTANLQNNAFNNDDANNHHGNDDADDDDDDDDSDTPSPDRVALIVCLLVNITFRGVVAELETVSTPFLMENFGMGFDSASYYVTAVGFVGLAVYLGFKPISRRVSDRELVVAGLLFAMLGGLPLGHTLFTSHMSAAFYVACIGIIWSLAYPIGQTAILALFSKVLAGLPAGGFLGIFSASGSLARVLFALFAGKMWSEFGREAVFASIVGYILLTLILTGVTYKRLQPHSY